MNILTPAFLVLAVIWQTPTQDSSDLLVLKVGVTKYRLADNGLIRGLDDLEPMNGPITINRQSTKNDSDQVRPARDPKQRGAELRGTEQAAVRSAQKPLDFYIYRIQLKNTGARLIKSFVLEYQTVPGVRDSSPRQFLCAAKAKANETKGIEIMSPSALSKVVDATNAGSDPQKTAGHTMVVNRIEYGDGSLWQRSGWDESILTRDNGQKLGGSKCVAL